MIARYSAGRDGDLLPARRPGHRPEALVTYKSLSPELAQDLAKATLADCRKRGFQVSLPLSIGLVSHGPYAATALRGPHTVSTATGKAWTAPGFRTSTTELAAISQPVMMQAENHAIFRAPSSSGAVASRTEPAARCWGWCRVSGASPVATQTKPAAGAGIEAVRDKLDF